MAWDRSDYDHVRYQAARDEIVDYLGGQCAQCGREDRLEIDHIDPSEKALNVSKRWNAGLHALDSELRKCQALCVDCHKAKTIAAKSVPHGGGLSGKRNCKCLTVQGP